jgi:hypothetical protein
MTGAAKPDLFVGLMLPSLTLELADRHIGIVVVTRSVSDRSLRLATYLRLS